MSKQLLCAENKLKSSSYILSLEVFYFLISFTGKLDSLPQVHNSFKTILFFLLPLVSPCDEELALATYCMTKEAGCSLPPTELSVCTC